MLSVTRRGEPGASQTTVVLERNQHHAESRAAPSSAKTLGFSRWRARLPCGQGTRATPRGAQRHRPSPKVYRSRLSGAGRAPLDRLHATSQRARSGASGPPRSRSAARRWRGSGGRSRTRRSARLAPSRGASWGGDEGVEAFRSWPSAPCLSSRRCGILIPEAKDRTFVR